MSRTKREVIYNIMEHFVSGYKIPRHYSIKPGPGCLYSYGSHFILVQLTKNRKGFVVNRDRYSVTTGQHQSAVLGFLYQHKYKFVSCSYCDEREIHNDFTDALKSLEKTFKNCRLATIDEKFNGMLHLIKQYQAGCQLLDVGPLVVCSPEEYRAQFLEANPKVKERYVYYKMRG